MRNVFMWVTPPNAPTREGGRPVCWLPVRLASWFYLVTVADAFQGLSLPLIPLSVSLPLFRSAEELGSRATTAKAAKPRTFGPLRELRATQSPIFLVAPRSGSLPAHAERACGINPFTDAISVLKFAEVICQAHANEHSHPRALDFRPRGGARRARPRRGGNRLANRRGRRSAGLRLRRDRRIFAGEFRQRPAPRQGHPPARRPA